MLLRTGSFHPIKHGAREENGSRIFREVTLSSACHFLEQGQEAETFTDVILGLKTGYYSYFTTHLSGLKEIRLEIQGFSF